MKKGVSVTLVIEGGRVKAHDRECWEVEEARKGGAMLVHMPVPKVPRDMPRCSCLRVAQ